MSFANLKKASRESNINKMLEVASQDKRKSFVDTRFWKPTLDKAKNGYAVLRFLPAPDGETIPWAKYGSYGFRGPTGQWYIENSLLTIGKSDPVADLNRKLWNTGSDDDKAVVRQRSQRTSYVSNVLVLKDSGNADNDGKLFLFRYGKKIHDKIVTLMQPQFEDEERVDPFDLWNGCNFRLKVQNIGGFTNYDKSQFDNPSPLFGGDDAQLETLYNSLHKLAPFTDPNNPEMYKSYEQLEQRLNLVLNGTGNMTAKVHESESVKAEAKQAFPTMHKAAEAVVAATTLGPFELPGDREAKTEAATLPEVKDDTSPEGHQATLSYFEKLANDQQL